VHGPVESAFRVEWRPHAELPAIAAQWRELASRAVERNIFYEPAFALAAMPVFGAGIGAGLVWSRATPTRLLGFFPGRAERRRYGVPLPILVGWTHPYAPLGSPLVDATACDDVIAAWLAHAGNSERLPKLILLPYLPAEGSLASAFDRALARRGGSQACFARHARALLAPSASDHHYLERAIDKKKRKELRRQRKRLADSGVVTTVISDTPAEIASALDDFFTLEASGWKGRARTAARLHPEIVSFMTAAVAALAAEGRAQIVRLCVDGRAVAAVVILRSGGSAWCWKIAYDEGRARFSPGVQVILDATAMLLADGDIQRVDSCATPDHPMIDHIWRERLVLADRLISLEPGWAFRFRAACALEASRRSAIAAAKAVRDWAVWT
jgi:CelD/BcsL family acetyltransferase involved in cellulose biosynthesis